MTLWRFFVDASVVSDTMVSYRLQSAEVRLMVGNGISVTERCVDMTSRIRACV